VLHCQLQPPRMIEQLVLDSSQLTATTRPGVLQLTADVQNRGAVPVRAPALELTITSETGQTLVRKVLDPRAGHPTSPPDRIEPDGTQSLTLFLSVGDLQVAGYTVELFYP
jgi:hypothetical protein